MRLSVRPGVRITRLPRIFTGGGLGLGRANEAGPLCFPGGVSQPKALPPRPFVLRELERTDNSSPIQRPPRLRAALGVAAQYPRPGAGILTGFPFGQAGAQA